MSSIGNDATEAQQVREYYREREKTLKEQHEREIAKMQEAHKTEVRNINQTNDERINRAGRDTQATIERRDMRHQKEINRMQQVHAAQRRRESVDRMREEEHLNNTYQDRLEKQGKVHNAQMQDLRQKTRQTIEGNNDSTGQAIEAFRQRSREENQTSRDRLQRQHEIEKREQQVRHRNELDAIIYKADGEKLNKDQKIASLERKHLYELEGLERRHKIALEDERYQSNEALKHIRDEHEYSVDKIQEKYNKSLRREKEELHNAQDRVYAQTGRLSHERERLNQKIRKLEHDNTKNMMNADTQRRRELDNLRYADKHAYDKLIDERRGMVKEFNRIHSEEIVLADEKADQRIKANYDYYTAKMKEENIRNKELLTDQRRKLITENNDKRKQNEMYLNQLQEGYKNDSAKLNSAHKVEKQRLQDRYELNLEKVRHDNDVQRNELRANFEKKVKEMDFKHRNELLAQKQSHDRHTTKLVMQQHQKVVDMKKKNERVLEEMARTYRERDRIKEAKYKNNMKNMQVHHRDQLDRLDNNYRRNMQELIRQGQQIRKQKA